MHVYSHLVFYSISGKQYYMTQTVVQHILAVLSEPYVQLALGMHYSNIFLKFILSDPFMCLSISPEVLDGNYFFLFPYNFHFCLMLQFLCKFHIILIISKDFKIFICMM